MSTNNNNENVRIIRGTSRDVLLEPAVSIINTAPGLRREMRIIAPSGFVQADIKIVYLTNKNHEKNCPCSGILMMSTRASQSRLLNLIGTRFVNAIIFSAKSKPYKVKITALNSKKGKPPKPYVMHPHPSDSQHSLDSQQAHVEIVYALDFVGGAKWALKQ